MRVRGSRRGLFATAVSMMLLTGATGWSTQAVAEPLIARTPGLPAPASATAPAAPPSPGQPLTPGQSVAVDGFGAHVSPDLSSVVVRSSELSRRTSVRNAAIDTVAAATNRKQQAVDSLRALDLELGRAIQAVTDATAALADARVVLLKAEALLQRRQTQQEEAEHRLTLAQHSLREVAVDAYMQSDDDMAWMSGDPEDLLTSASGQVTSEAVAKDRIDRVLKRKDELKAARAAVAVATDAVAVAVQKVADRTTDLADRRADVADTELRIDEAHLEDRSADQALASSVVKLAAAQIAVADARLLSIVDGADFPLVALDAYWKAAEAAPCPIAWWALAGITQVESQHGTYRGASLDIRGVASPAIIGIPLNGENNTALIRDSDGGALDFDPVFDRAVGPMQFIPSTWRPWAADGNGDGVMSPHDLYDVAMAAGRYLCASGRDLTSDAGLRVAYFTYNFSAPYVEQVLSYARGYQASVDIPV